MTLRAPKLSNVVTGLLMVAILASLPIKALARDPMFRAQQDVLYSDGCKSGAGSSSGTTPDAGSGAGSDCEGKPLPDSVPEPWRSLIDNAAKEHPDVDRRTVAAELWVENRGWPDPNKSWATSPAGAGGPWQFMPASWDSMGQDGDGDGIADRNNPKDAVHGAFNHNKGTACKPILEGATGDALSDYENVPFMRDGTNTLMSSIANYNGRGAPNGVPIGKSPTGDENSDYTKMAYWLIATDFKQTINEKTGEMIDARTGGGADGTGDFNTGGGADGASGAEGGSCSSEESKKDDDKTASSGDGSSSGQFANPLPNGTLTECYAGRGGSHMAIDISSVGGTGPGSDVLASDGGTVTMVDDGDYGGFGKTVIVKHQNGYYTRYSHLYSVGTKVGDNVTKGQVVGREGNTGSSYGTHLDFGISKDPGVPNTGTSEDPLKFIDKGTVTGSGRCG